MEPRLGDSDRCKDLLQREVDRFYDLHPKSYDLYQEALYSLPKGAPSGVSVLWPFPLAVDRGEGAYVYDIDGNRYVDYQNGFGTSVFGHAHPLITRAIQDRAAKGTHFGAVTPECERWADHLCDRFNLQWVRFSCSGTEATMDAIRLARAATGRVKIAKIEGAYHGMHDAAMISGNMPLDGSEGPDERPEPRLFSAGMSSRVAEEVAVLPFNNLDAAEELLAGGEIACVIVEPIMFNVGTIFPDPGYLAALRQLCDSYGTLLIFDETKTGVTIRWGGAEEYFGVKPHIKTLGKGIGGGLPAGAFGDTDGSLRDLIENWTVPHFSTFAGNPLVAAAGSVALEQVLTPQAYSGLEAHFHMLKEKLEQVITDYDLPAYIVGAGAKGCFVWSSRPEFRDFREYARRFDKRLAFLTWVYLVNRGIFLAPGHDEQWTASVFHGETEAETFAAAMAELAADLRS